MFIPPRRIVGHRHTSKLLHGRLPALNIVVGCWVLSEKVHNDCETLLAATHCAATLIETCDQIARAMNPHIKLQPDPA